ncbi:3-oxoadipate enol-lactonase [Roseibium polysiphoniae]|uniref:3-oxoadipate enol-lactonase n=1 Tax=Roseibium polysiphoniae TaxID=2571221 RepID=UPI00329A3D24
MNMIRVNGQVLHFADTGEPNLPVLVFANSLGTDFRIWDRVCAQLAEKFRLVRYDKRGHGLSTAPASPYAMDDHVDDLTALLDALKLTSVILVGLSVGGQIAQGIALKRPELVQALVLCDTAVKIGDQKTWTARMEAIDAGGIEVLAEAILERWFSADFRTQRADELEGWRAMLVRTPRQGYLGTCAAIRGADFTPQAAQLKLPVLCVCGTEDLATTPELVQATAGLIENARYVPIKGAGHLPCIEFPDELVGAMTDFFQENSLV